jgi:hypothetical protein
MVLDYLAAPVNYKRLRQTLGTTEAGTPFPHPRHPARSNA